MRSTATDTVAAEDLRLVKSASTGTFTQGQLVTYTLAIDTSEYVTLDGLAITDTIPDGICPIDSTTNWTALAECAAQSGQGPPTPPSAASTANPDGSYTVVLTPNLTALDANGHMQITYKALMRSNYGHGRRHRSDVVGRHLHQSRPDQRNQHPPAGHQHTRQWDSHRLRRVQHHHQRRSAPPDKASDAEPGEHDLLCDRRRTTSQLSLARRPRSPRATGPASCSKSSSRPAPTPEAPSSPTSSPST